MMSLLTSSSTGQKEEEKLTAVMVTFFFYFECDLQGLSVQVLFKVALSFPLKLPKLCSPVAEECGLSGPRNL